MKIHSLLSILPLAFLAGTAIAGDSYVDLRNVNLSGEVVEISAPNILKIETIKNSKRVHFFIDIIHVDFGQERGEQCNNNTSRHNPIDRSSRQDKKTLHADPAVANACKRMGDWLEGEKVSVEVTEWTQPILKGFVFHGETNVGHDLIKRGVYPVDYMQSRDASLVLLEKSARCSRAGIWQSKKGNPVEDLKCMN